MDPTLTELALAQMSSVEALYEIALESNDAAIVRRAVAGLLATPTGAAYLVAHGLNA